MDTAEYQVCLEEISRLADELRDLGEREAEWTDEDTELWNQTDTAYKQALQRKEDEDKRRTKVAVQDRLTDLQKPVSRAVPMPASILRRRTETPKYAGTLQAFRGEDAVDNAYDCGLWLQSKVLGDQRATKILEQRQPEWRVQTEGIATAGGYTVPDPMSQTIIEVLNEVSVALQVSDVITMGVDTLRVPKVTGGPTTYYPGEKGSITLSDMSWGEVLLQSVKRATLTKVSNELIADSAINFADRVARRAGYEIAYQFDNEFINGDGTSTYGGQTGLVNSIGEAGSFELGSGDTAWSDVVLQDFTDTAALLPDRYWVDANLCWIMRRDFYAGTVAKLLYAAGGNTTSDIQAGVWQPMLMGYPVKFTARMPDAAAGAVACFFGNFTESVIVGMRSDISMASSSDYAFNEDVTTLRSIMRACINVHEPGTASAAGAYVSMELAAS